MVKTLLITGATDGIGFETAKRLASEGHTLLLHGRSREKLDRAQAELAKRAGAGAIQTYCADFSKLSEVDELASAVAAKHSSLDVLINNAGVFKTSKTRTNDGHDVRFIVNSVAPYHLTEMLLPLLSSTGRIVNLSSAAQAPVKLDALGGKEPMSDSDAYAQSKLAITMWSFHMANTLPTDGPTVIAVNPGSFLASKMVKEAYGRAGNDLSIGVDILYRTAFSSEFAHATGRYFDNDRGEFSSPHPDALDDAKNEKLVAAIKDLIANLLSAKTRR
ncbi:MAG: SDR family NAD(P)-dependent oxidoreductase [Pseudomonadota bacterium]